MSKILSFVLLCLLLLLHELALGQNTYTYLEEITGIVLREDSLTPIQGAVVYNRNSFLGTLTNKIGTFKMRVKKGDTLQVSHLGFVNYLLYFDNLEFDKKDRIRIIMRLKVYQLEEVDVRAYRIRQKNKPQNYSMRRTDNRTIDIGKVKLDESLKGYIPSNNNTYNPMMGMLTFGIPLGSFREARRQAQYDKIARLEAVDNVRRYVQYRYSKKVVNELTGLTGNELENFMNYCKPTDKMVLASNDYDMAYFILNCYEKFRIDNDQ